MVMSWFTGFVVVYHNHFEFKPGLCCSCCDPRGCSSLCDCSGKLETTTTQARKGVAEDAKLPPLRQFFKTTFPFDWLLKDVRMRIGVLVFFAAALIPLGISASQVQPSTTTIQFLPDWHPFQRFLNIGSEFGASQDDQTEGMQIVWGFENAGLDTAGSNLLFVKDANNMSASDYGTILYSPTFRFDEATQLHLKSACALLETYDDDVKFTCALPPQRGLSRGSPFASGNPSYIPQLPLAARGRYSADGANETANVQCFVTAWEQWLWTSEGGSGSSGISPPTFPMAEADAPASLLEFVRVNPEYVNDVGFGTGANDDLVIHFATVRADSKILTNAFYPSPELRAFHATWEAIVDVCPAQGSNPRLQAPTPPRRLRRGLRPSIRRRHRRSHLVCSRPHVCTGHQRQRARLCWSGLPSMWHRRGRTQHVDLHGPSGDVHPDRRAGTLGFGLELPKGQHTCSHRPACVPRAAGGRRRLGHRLLCHPHLNTEFHCRWHRYALHGAPNLDWQPQAPLTVSVRVCWWPTVDSPSDD